MRGTALASAVRARKLTSMGRVVTVFALATILAGCDMAGSAATATVEADSSVRDAAGAHGTESRVRTQIDAAYQQAADQRQAAEADGR